MKEDEEEDLGPAVLVRETSMAVLVKLTERKREVWIPKSVLSDDSEIYGKDAGKDGEEGRCIVKKWWADKEF